MKVIGPYVMSAVPQAGTAPDSAAQIGPDQGAAVQGGTVTVRPRTPQRRRTDATPARPDFLDSPATPASPVPMHGLDRLTGMPVLLHRLGEFVVPLPLPASPHLLPVGEVDIWDAQPYAVTELPLSASPATDPLLAAHGALMALAALHRAQLVHGGLNAGQLWQVGKDVRVAGAGLPWDPAATAATDMQALGQALDALGPRPRALRDLERLSAEQALTRLSEAGFSAGPGPLAPDAGSAPGQDEAAPGDARPPHEPGTPVAVEAAQAEPAPGTPLPEGAAAAPEVAAPAPVLFRSQQDIIVIGELEQGGAGEPDDPAADTARSPNGPDHEPAPSPPPVHLIPAPIRIGFDGVPALPADWEPEGDRRVGGDLIPAHDPEVAPALTVAEQQRLKGEAALDDFAHGAPTLTPASPAPAAAAGRNRPPGVPSAAGPKAKGSETRGQPLRIGWEEDHSWRVVKSGPERAPAAVRRLPTWLPAALLVLVLGGAALWLAGRGGTPAAACCTQRFTVSGSGPVKVTLVQGPPGSTLLPGAVLGTVSGAAPVALKFPDAPGRYTLRFSAQGHGTLSGAVSVPSAQPFKIVLK